MIVTTHREEAAAFGAHQAAIRVTLLARDVLPLAHPLDMPWAPYRVVGGGWRIMTMTAVGEQHRYIAKHQTIRFPDGSAVEV